MGLIWTTPDELQELTQQHESMLERQRELIAECEIVEKDLEGYKSVGYDHFKREVLEREKMRLAQARMRLGNAPEDHDEHMKLLGQFNEVEALQRRPETLRAHLVHLTAQLRQNAKSLDKVKQQIEGAASARKD